MTAVNVIKLLRERKWFFSGGMTSIYPVGWPPTGHADIIFSVLPPVA